MSDEGESIFKSYIGPAAIPNPDKQGPFDFTTALRKTEVKYSIAFCNSQSHWTFEWRKITHQQLLVAARLVLIGYQPREKRLNIWDVPTERARRYLEGRTWIWKSVYGYSFTKNSWLDKYLVKELGDWIDIHRGRRPIVLDPRTGAIMYPSPKI